MEYSYYLLRGNGLDERVVMEAINRAKRRFFLRPSYISRHLGDVARLAVTKQAIVWQVASRMLFGAPVTRGASVQRAEQSTEAAGRSYRLRSTLQESISQLWKEPMSHRLLLQAIFSGRLLARSPAAVRAHATAEAHEWISGRAAGIPRDPTSIRTRATTNRREGIGLWCSRLPQSVQLGPWSGPESTHR